MEKTSDYEKRYTSLVSTLQKSVECPVCLEAVKPPFKVCKRGHSVCLDCIKKMEKCPLCQELFTLENLICLTNVLEVLPRSCCYSDAGCKELVEPGNDHEMFCGYRPIVCRFQGCSDKIPLIECSNHFKSRHSDALVITESVIAAVQPKYFTLTTFRYTLVSLFNNLFWILKVYDDTKKEFNIFFQATPIGKLEHDYYVRVEFRGNEFVYTYTLKAQVLSSCENKLVVKDSPLDNKYCMKIPQEELHNFLNDDGQLRYIYTFFEK